RRRAARADDEAVRAARAAAGRLRSRAVVVARGPPARLQPLAPRRRHLHRTRARAARMARTIGRYPPLRIAIADDSALIYSDDYRAGWLHGFRALGEVRVFDIAVLRRI